MQCLNYLHQSFTRTFPIFIFAKLTLEAGGLLDLSQSHKFTPRICWHGSCTPFPCGCHLLKKEVWLWTTLTRSCQCWLLAQGVSCSPAAEGTASILLRLWCCVTAMSPHQVPHHLEDWVSVLLCWSWLGCPLCWWYLLGHTSCWLRLPPGPLEPDWGHSSQLMLGKYYNLLPRATVPNFPTAKQATFYYTTNYYNMLHFKILTPLLPASFSLRREGCSENHHLMFAASIKGSSTKIWIEDTVTLGLSQAVDSFKPHQNSEAKPICKNMIMRHERRNAEQKQKEEKQTSRKAQRKHRKNIIRPEKSCSWIWGGKKKKEICGL